jgi:hypothetical protein
MEICCVKSRDLAIRVPDHAQFDPRGILPFINVLH